MAAINLFITYPGISKPIKTVVDVETTRVFEELIPDLIKKFKLPTTQHAASNQFLTYHFELVHYPQSRIRLASFEVLSSFDIARDDNLWLVGETEAITHLKSTWHDVFREELWLGDLISSKKTEIDAERNNSQSQFVKEIRTIGNTLLALLGNHDSLPPPLEDINQIFRRYLRDSQTNPEDLNLTVIEIIQILHKFRARNQRVDNLVNNKSRGIRRASIKIGIVTALEEECAAVRSLLKNPFECKAKSSMRQYIVGEVPSKHGGSHQVILLLPIGLGNNAAATNVADLLHEFPKIEEVIMVGIAGGIPFPQKPEDHVRLGDIVISSEYGVIQYDFDKETVEKIVSRPYPRPPSPILLQAVKLLRMNEKMGLHPWEKYIDKASNLLSVTRPKNDSDILFDTCDPNQKIEHPQDTKRKEGYPRVFVGPIASANTLLKNPHKRDLLRDQYGVMAVEMEGSGVAEATWFGNANYFIVRGICDYCDSNKNDEWHDYAAIAAAAYTRALLEAVPCGNR